jgi:hypothetical protein
VQANLQRASARACARVCVGGGHSRQARSRRPAQHQCSTNEPSDSAPGAPGLPPPSP